MEEKENKKIICRDWIPCAADGAPDAACVDRTKIRMMCATLSLFFRAPLAFSLMMCARKCWSWTGVARSSCRRFLHDIGTLAYAGVPLARKIAAWGRREIHDAELSFVFFRICACMETAHRTLKQVA